MRTILLLATLTVPFGLADDDDDEHDDRPRPARPAVPPDPSYAKECGSCHLAFPPPLLPARTWVTILGNLGDHFGDDASLPDEKRAALTAWLVASAGRDRGDDTLRVTGTRWFRSEHDELPGRLVGPAAEVKSWAACASCHPGAARGSFDEEAIRVPGLGRWED
ncbi:MAG: cytochrome C [Myxococcota bacterium]